MNIGDTVYLAYAAVYLNDAMAYVNEATVMAIVDNRPVFRTASSVREQYMSETVHESEAAAWGAASVQLAKLADKIRAAADDAAAKAARGAVTVAA